MTLYRAWSLQCLPTRVSGSRVDDPEEEAETMRPRGTAAARLDGGEPGMGAGLPARCGGVDIVIQITFIFGKLHVNIFSGTCTTFCKDGSLFVH